MKSDETEGTVLPVFQLGIERWFVHVAEIEDVRLHDRQVGGKYEPVVVVLRLGQDGIIFVECRPQRVYPGLVSFPSGRSRPATLAGSYEERPRTSSAVLHQHVGSEKSQLIVGRWRQSDSLRRQRGVGKNLPRLETNASEHDDQRRHPQPRCEEKAEDDHKTSRREYLSTGKGHGPYPPLLQILVIGIRVTAISKAANARITVAYAALSISRQQTRDWAPGQLANQLLRQRNNNLRNPHPGSIGASPIHFA